MKRVPVGNSNPTKYLQSSKGRQRRDNAARGSAFHRLVDAEGMTRMHAAARAPVTMETYFDTDLY